MIVKWLGHSCFLLKSEQAEGPVILMDPFFEEEVGYAMPSINADIVVISHDHDDHNNVQAAGDYADVIAGPGEFISRGLDLFGIKSYHDAVKGRLRGENTIFCFELDGVRICHLGDLGHKLTKKQIRDIGRVDLLFVPVGGRYTIDAAGANLVIEALRPAYAVPMHYHTAALSFSIAPVDPFLLGKDCIGVQEELQINAQDTPMSDARYNGTVGTKVVLLSCPCAEGAGQSID